MNNDQEQEVKVMSGEERDSFRGQTIEEDGTIREEKELPKDHYDQRRYSSSQQGIPHQSIFHFAMSNLPLRVKLALGFIIFCVVAVIIGVLGLIVAAMPYLLGILAIYFVYTIVKSVFFRS